MKPVQIPSLMSIGTTVIELREFKEKKKKKKNNAELLPVALGDAELYSLSRWDSETSELLVASQDVPCRAGKRVNFQSRCTRRLLPVVLGDAELLQHGQNRKSMFSSNMKRKWYYSEIFHTQFCFDMFYTIKSPEVEIT